MTIIETDQSRDISLTEIARGSFVLRYLSYRKSEDAAMDLRSEDYIVSEFAPEKAIFVLCDGVGSSFYGNIGSQILGEILLNWLGKVSIPSQFTQKWSAQLTGELTSELNGKTTFATSIVQQKELSDQNEMMRLAETTQRDDFGTQSNFACGIVWAKSAFLPKGLVLLFWLGNARLKIFKQNKDLSLSLDWGIDPKQLLEVWSSKDGVVGTVHSYFTDLSEITNIIAYSDGLENSDELIRPKLTGEQLETLVLRSQSIKDDDATFVELSVENIEVPGQADDLVSPLRKHFQTVSSKVNPTNPDVQKMQATLDTLQKKYDTQTRKNQSTRGILLAALVFFMISCFFLGLGIAPAVRQILNPPTLTSTPSKTAEPTPTSTITPTFTDTALPSSSPTLPTNTAISTATETAIPALLDGTITVLSPEVTASTSFDASTQGPSTPTSTGP